MNRSAAVLLAVLAAVAVAPLPQTPASASCAAPMLEVDTGTTLEAGTDVTVEGRAFVDGCRDSMSCPAFGCGSCEYDDPPEVPFEDVGLRLVQGGRSWPLGEADAGSADDNRLGHVSWTFEVPEGVQPGRARLVADHGAEARVRIG